MAEFWEQQPDETQSAFLAFCFNRASQAPRSPLRAYRDWKKDHSLKRVPGRWQIWARDNRWDDRALAYDLHIDQVRTSTEKKVVAEIAEQCVRELEMSALATLKETTVLAHAKITDFCTWDADGKLRMKPSDQIPEHLVGAISEIVLVTDKEGKVTLVPRLHSKVRPLALLGQHYDLWENAKEQTRKNQTNAFLEFLDFIKSDEMDKLPQPWGTASLKNPPPGIVVEIEGVKK